MTLHYRLFAILFLAVMAIAAPVRADNIEKPWASWQTSIDGNHPHVGRIWSVGENQFISHQKLVQALAGADFRLLGETHDNPDHHRLQAWLIREIARQGKQPVIVLEMIDRDQAAALESYLANPGADAAGLGAAIDWAHSSWPDWEIYQPIAEAALKAELDLMFGNETRSRVRETAMNGLESLGADRLAALKLDQPLEDPLSAALSHQIVEAHCNLLPVEATGPMAQAQRFRDGVMAEQMILNSGKDGAILIAGSGHVRNDRGVPWYLARHAPTKTSVSLMLVEALSDLNLRDMIPMNPNNNPAADYFWFTPRAERADPCEEMRRQINARQSD